MSNTCGAALKIYMKIKKNGHCCLLIQTNNLTILTDHGSPSTDSGQVARDGQRIFDRSSRAKRVA